ncbi:AraC family transcriptional regulator [Caballeronia udeis]|uniref:AraC family transcriptional regulator n=1 Tax=Caballeronia udeis TaxID=1232866 RepID=A0A158JIC9_9BURK|nr:AraC family transcriptional regulator [Caballeronia udeis]
MENVGFAVNAPMLTLSISRAALDRRLPEGAKLHGASWEADDLIGAMVASHMHTLARLATGTSTEQTYLAADATLDLLAACLLPQAKSELRQGDPRLTPMLHAQASSYIERHLLDPDLGPAALCKALKISRTALYALFAESGGVAKRVKERRLDEALRRLTAPRHARVGLSARRRLTDRSKSALAAPPPKPEANCWSRHPGRSKKCPRIWSKCISEKSKG